MVITYRWQVEDGYSLTDRLRMVLTYRWQVEDGIDIALVFLYFLPVSENLLHFLRVHILRPAAFCMVNASVICLKSLSVHLKLEFKTFQLV